ncbi:MAG TPA: VWA domain-containing protein, partial [Labilithrix sp.]|nr:VWA domain-containing protein [Labilithrix sp.]
VTHVSFAQRAVALDRDVVVTASPRRRTSEIAPLASVVAHRAGPIGTFALTVVPDLVGARGRREVRTDVVFVMDRSGSMGGASIEEARAALRLCLRQLREGDRFAILAFDDQIEAMSPALVTFTRSSLAAADRWIDGIDARGGTELLAPLVRATDLAPDGLVVLLTDGQVGNEDEIARAVLARRGAARIHAFGIGTNVSDALLRTLAERTGGAAEMIHPGERIDEKVVAQFARATAPRLTDVRITFRGVEIGELAPAAPVAVVDGEAFTLFGTYEGGGIGAVEIRGLLRGETTYLEVPLDLPERADRPVVEKLWAQARIRDLERAELTGRRAEAMKHRIVQLAKDHGVSSRYTSFVVVERRAGSRRVDAPAETRVIPVSAPAGWAMFGGGGAPRSRSRGYGGPVGSAPPPPRATGRMAAMAPMACRSPAPQDLVSRSAPAMAVPPAPAPRRSPPPPSAPAREPMQATLERQSASGLWEDERAGTLEATVHALVALVRLGLSTSHPVYGAQTRKAVEALLALVERSDAADARLLELALAAMWLLATGRRTRTAVEEEAARRGRSGLVDLLARGGDVRALVERLAPMC